MDTQNDAYIDREPDEDAYTEDRYEHQTRYEPDCEHSPDGEHHWGADEYDNRCIDCDRKPWYETATAAGRKAKAEREAAIAALEPDIW